MGRPPVACSLSGSEAAARAGEFRADLDGRVLELDREGSGLRLKLRETPGLKERLERLVELERVCCPFLDLSLVCEAGHLILRIDGPPEAATVIDDFAALAS
jgi:hypothetical protein